MLDKLEFTRIHESSVKQNKCYGVSDERQELISFLHWIGLDCKMEAGKRVVKNINVERIKITFEQCNSFWFIEN